MNLITEIETLLDTNSGNFTYVHLPVSDVRALVEYVKAAETFRKAYFNPENFAGNTKEMSLAWYEARVKLGLI